MMTMQTIYAPTNGNICFIVSDGGSFPEAEATNTAVPTGGIIAPRPVLMAIIIQNTIGWIPTPVAMGSITGKSIMISGVSSINIASNQKMNIIINMIIAGLVLRE